MRTAQDQPPAPSVGEALDVAGDGHLRDRVVSADPGHPGPGGRRSARSEAGA